jgi:deoxyribonuclease V
VVLVEGRVVDSTVVRGDLGSPYAPGLLALREGRLLEEVLLRLRQLPDVLLVNASGRDHPRRAGLALHLGAVCGVPTVGVTDRPLVGLALEPGQERGAAAELWLDDEVVGYRLRTRAGARAVVVHAGWRVDPQAARELVLGQVSFGGRTPEPIRQARRLARTARARAVA